MKFMFKQPVIPQPNACLPGRDACVRVPSRHFVNGNPLQPPFPSGLQQIVFGMGCFWGAEKMYWQTHGVFTTAAGYAGGYTPNPAYEEVCSGLTGHTEVVQVVYDPLRVSVEELIGLFWENHDPTQGMRQGNDIGTQYRSAIFCNSEEQLRIACAAREAYQANLSLSHHGVITTEISGNITFYYAEEHHQQYLAKVPNGYCMLAGTGVCYTGRSSQD